MIDIIHDIDEQDDNKIKFAIIKRDGPEGDWTHVLDKKTWKKREGTSRVDPTGGPTFSIEKDHIEDLLKAFAVYKTSIENKDLYFADLFKTSKGK